MLEFLKETYLESDILISIEFKNVCKKFPGNDKFSVDDVSAKIKDGEFITILGSSGSGKTTLLKMINRLYDPDSGQILLFGEDISEKNAVELRRSIGYVIQQVGLFPHMAIEKNVSILLDGDRIMVINQGKLLQFDMLENIVKNSEN